jgi:coproporphyrinogen III oxidase-like Fe-S oxidoreductase
MEDWLAFGPGASGTIRDGDRATRTRIPSDADSYLSSGPKAEIELLDRSATMAETLMMGFRLSDGPDPDRFLARYGLALESCVPTTLHAWRSRGLVDPDRPRLNGEGLLLLNPFLVDCISELESTGFLPVQGASGAGPYDVRYDVSLR